MAARCARGIALYLLEHGELIRVHRLIFMDARLDMPAREVSAITPGKRPRAKSADRNSLPVAVINVSRDARHARVFKRQSEWALPCTLGDALLT